MLNGVLRVIIILWAAVFGLIAIRGIVSPASYNELLGLLCSSSSTNALRADLSSFFLVAAGGALYGTMVPGAARALWVPAALFGTALVGRLYGLMFGGDMISADISLGLLIEAISVTLMLFGWWHFSRPVPVVQPAAVATGTGAAPAAAAPPPVTDADLP